MSEITLQSPSLSDSSCWSLSCRLIHRHMPDEVLVHQLKVLPPASFSLRLATHTLPSAMRLPLPAPLGTFTH